MSSPISGSNPEVPPTMRVVRGFIRLQQLVALALAIAPGLANLALRHFGIEGPFPEGWIRFMAIGDFVAMSIALVVLPGGTRGSARANAWSKMAEETGGEYRVEKRGLGSLGWTGGPTVQWNLQGVEVTLAQVTPSKGSASTRFTALFPMEKDLRLSVLPNNFLTRTLTSTKFVALVQANVRGSSGSSTEAARASAAQEIAILAGARVTLGDSRLDEALIVKSNDSDLARYVLTGSGVSERMNDLMSKRKGWTLSLYAADVDQGARLALEFPGTESRPEALIAGRALVEALLSSLCQNGVVASSGRGFGHDALPRRSAR